MNESLCGQQHKSSLEETITLSVDQTFPIKVSLADKMNESEMWRWNSSHFICYERSIAGQNFWISQLNVIAGEYQIGQLQH
jgi:hypothetical protein